jgi:hypothetical protein
MVSSRKSSQSTMFGLLLTVPLLVLPRTYIRNQDVRLSVNPDYVPANVHHSVQNLPAVFGTQRQGDQLLHEDWRQRWAFWRNVIGEYSHRQISFLTDRFSAISAVAKKIQDISGDDFCEGIWKSDIAHQLLWKKSPKEHMLYSQISPLQPRPDAYIAPTWSWLSCRGRVVYPSFEICPKFKVENVGVELVNSSEPFGPVKSGSVTLIGRLEHINIFDQSHAGFHWLGRKTENFVRDLLAIRWWEGRSKRAS